MLRFPLPREGGIEDELISAYSADFPQTIILSNRKVGPIIKLPRENYNYDDNNFTIYFTLTDFTFTCKLENPRKFAACSDKTREKSYQNGGKSGAERDSCLATTPSRLETIWRSY